MQDVPGYAAQELLGSGRSGVVWRALHGTTGESVVLRQLPAGTSGVELRREVAAQRSLTTPYLLRLREVVEVGGSVVLVADHAAGGSLTRLLTRRGRLDPGEVVTIAAPLAQALAVVHAGGRVHGGVRLTNVLFTADGMPLLADLGIVRPSDGVAEADCVDPRVLAGEARSAASDVWSLAAVCRMLGGSELPPALAAVVGAGLAADPAVRLDAAAFAAVLLRAHPPAPVRLSGPLAAVPGSAALFPLASGAATGRRGPGHRAVALGAAGALALLLAAGVGWASGQQSVDPSSPGLPPATIAAPVPPSPPAGRAVVPSDWRTVVEALDAVRALAFERADVRVLAAVWAPGTAGLAADTVAVRRLAAAGHTAAGVQHDVMAVQVVQQAAQRVVLRVTDRLGSHSVRDARGRRVHVVGARPATSYDVVLVLLRGQWRLSSVTP